MLTSEHFPIKKNSNLNPTGSELPVVGGSFLTNQEECKMSTYFQNAAKRSDGKTLILSNGSKWAGSVPDGLETLLEVLSKDVLDPKFEKYHCWRPYTYTPEVKGVETADYLRPWVGAKTFFGNFLNLSHVFNIISVDPEVIGKLEQAIQKNVVRAEYQEEAAKEYAGWYYAVNNNGYLLVPPHEAEDIRNGTVTKSRYMTRYPTLESAQVIGPWTPYGH